MGDPFKALGRAERQRAATWLLILVTFLATIALVFSRARSPQGKLIEGSVESFGGPISKYGDIVVTVRLANGSVREVLTKWASVRGCKRGDRIALIQRGTALNVGIKACNFPTQPNDHFPPNLAIIDPLRSLAAS